MVWISSTEGIGTVAASIIKRTLPSPPYSYRIPVDSSGFQWIPVDSSGFQWIPVDSSGLL